MYRYILENCMGMIVGLPGQQVDSPRAVCYADNVEITT